MNVQNIKLPLDRWELNLIKNIILNELLKHDSNSEEYKRLYYLYTKILHEVLINGC